MTQTAPNEKIKRETNYYYRDETGREAFVIVRYDWTEDGKKKKDCRVKHRAENRHYVWKRPNCNYPYNLPAVLAAPADQIIFVVEGEKKAELLIAQGVTATTNAFGAGRGKWPPAWAKYFQDKIAVVIPDNDAPGVEHAGAVLELLEPACQICTLLALEELADKEGLDDWLEKPGNDVARLLALAQESIKQAAATVPAEASLGDAYEPPEDELAEKDEVDTHWKPFPLDALPPALADYSYHGAQALGCDPAYLALAAICVAGGAIGNSRLIQLKPTWLEPSVFWGTVIADSSSMKSPAIDMATEPLFSIQGQLGKEFRTAYKQYKRDIGDQPGRGRIKVLPLNERNGDGEVEKPEEGRLVISDITIEKVADLLQKNPHGLMLIRDEIAGWFGSFARYKQSSGGGSDLPAWLEIFRAKTIVQDRKTGDMPTIMVPRAAVSVFGGIQPKMCSRMFTREMFDSGLLARLLFTLPPRRAKKWSEDVIPMEVGENYRNLIRSLYGLDKDEVHSEHYVPRVVHLSDKGKAKWVEFYNAWGQRQNEAHGEHGYALAKLEAYAARFSLLGCVCGFVGGFVKREVVEAFHVESAITLVNWFSQEAIRCYSLLQRTSSDVDRDHLVAFIKSQGGKITARRLFRSNPSRYKNCGEARIILEGMVSAHVGRWQYVQPGEKGGRPSEHFILDT